MMGGREIPLESCYEHAYDEWCELAIKLQAMSPDEDRHDSRSWGVSIQPFE